MIVCAYYTIDTPYEKIVKTLLESCVKFNLQYYVKGYPDEGTWCKNVHIKPRFILHCLEYQDDDVLYIDADAIVRKYPVLFDDFDADVGVFNKWKEPLCGTLFFKNNKASRRFIKQWIICCKDWEFHHDQGAFEIASRKVKDVSIQCLPPTYVLIFDTMKHMGEPVIEHFQASREHRKDRDVMVGMSGIRVLKDGTLMIPRSNKALEDALDKKHIRYTGELRWVERKDAGLPMSDLEGLFTNGVYIVGKGPSLDRLVREDFTEPWPILAINESVHTIARLELENKVFGVQQDTDLKDTCLAPGTKVLVSHKTHESYSDTDKYIYYPQEYNLTDQSLTVLIAIALAEHDGCENFTLLAFDSFDSELSYAKSIGYEPEKFGQSRQRFVEHCEILGRKLKTLSNVTINPACKDVCISQQSQEHLEERRALLQEGH